MNIRKPAIAIYAALAMAASLSGCARSSGIEADGLKASPRVEPVIRCAPEATATAGAGQDPVQLAACTPSQTAERHS